MANYAEIIKDLRKKIQLEEITTKFEALDYVQERVMLETLGDNSGTD